MNVFRFGVDEFDPSHRFETSWLISPWILFFTRATIFIYVFVLLIFKIIWSAVQPSYGGTETAGQSFSYFTNLSYWGMGGYFLFASLHTLSYSRHGTPYLNRWRREFQSLHSFLYTTIINFPILVTIVFWIVLFNGSFSSRYDSWSNISEHAMNSLFALFELLLTRTDPPLWIHLLWLLFILALYLCLAYLTHYTQGFYVYDFLDPSGGHGGKTAGYVLGIAAGIVIIFLATKFLIWGRKWVTEKKWNHTGKLHSMAQRDSEIETARTSEK